LFFGVFRCSFSLENPCRISRDLFPPVFRFRIGGTPLIKLVSLPFSPTPRASTPSPSFRLRLFCGLSSHLKSRCLLFSSLVATFLAFAVFSSVRRYASACPSVPAIHFSVSFSTLHRSQTGLSPFSFFFKILFPCLPANLFLPFFLSLEILVISWRAIKGREVPKQAKSRRPLRKRMLFSFICPFKWHG